MFNQGRDAQKKLIEQQPNLLDYFGSDYADRGETYKYTILVVLTGIDAAFLDLEFKEDGAWSRTFHRRAWRPFRWNTYHWRFDLADRGPPIAKSHPCARRSDRDPPKHPNHHVEKGYWRLVGSRGRRRPRDRYRISSGEKANFTPDRPSGSLHLNRRKHRPVAVRDRPKTGKGRRFAPAPRLNCRRL